MMETRDEGKFQPATIDPHAWTVIDSYERADGSRTWRAMGPWRATRKEAERDAEHGSMLGALPEGDGVTTPVPNRPAVRIVGPRDEVYAALEELQLLRELAAAVESYHVETGHEDEGAAVQCDEICDAWLAWQQRSANPHLRRTT